jgi:hypothetical protein
VNEFELGRQNLIGFHSTIIFRIFNCLFFAQRVKIEDDGSEMPQTQSNRSLLLQDFSEIERNWVNLYAEIVEAPAQGGWDECDANEELPSPNAGSSVSILVKRAGQRFIWFA